MDDWWEIRFNPVIEGQIHLKAESKRKDISEHTAAMKIHISSTGRYILYVVNKMNGYAVITLMSLAKLLKFTRPRKSMLQSGHLTGFSRLAKIPKQQKQPSRPYTSVLI